MEIPVDHYDGWIHEVDLLDVLEGIGPERTPEEEYDFDLEQADAEDRWLEEMVYRGITT